jgi:hypothetical protein
MAFVSNRFFKATRITEFHKPPEMVQKGQNWRDNGFLLKIDRLPNIEHLPLCETREINQRALIKIIQYFSDILILLPIPSSYPKGTFLLFLIFYIFFDENPSHPPRRK